MKKVIALSTVLALGALGMACGDTAPNTNSTNVKPANTATPAPVNTATPAPVNTGNTGNMGNTKAPETKPADGKMDNSNAKKEEPKKP
jgi:hypothetical protein